MMCIFVSHNTWTDITRDSDLKMYTKGIFKIYFEVYLPQKSFLSMAECSIITLT